MYKGQRTAVIIAAAGKGTRMGSDVPKQYMNVGGMPMVARTFAAFAGCPYVDSIIVVTEQEMTAECDRLIRSWITGRQAEKFAGTVAGGAERQKSVSNALEVLCSRYPDTEIVLIHDAARPYVTEKIIEDTIAAVWEKDAAVVCVPVKDTIRTAETTLDRNTLMAVQTPQGFRKDLIVEAHRKAEEEGFTGTDDAGLVERTGTIPAIVEGSYGNIKITTAEDLPCEYRIGTGFDVHRFEEGRKCILGGVDIPHEKGLAGHSDADVLTHAVMDAVLGAAGKGDIGKLFPDTDDAFLGADSIGLLEHVGHIIRADGYSIVNIDCTVICERPRISEYTEEMKVRMSAALHTDAGRISVKGTTTEKLGFTGRKEGIAAQATALLAKK